MTLQTRSRSGAALVGTLLLTLPLLVGQGCPTLNLGGLVGGSVVVKSPSVDTTLSAGTALTVVYDASASPVTAFYDLDGVSDSGDETVFASNLQTGTDRFTQLQTANLTPNAYRIGIKSNGVSAYAPGRLIIGSAPAIAFTSPIAAVKVGAGVAVPVRFGTGIQEFTWTTFYDRDLTGAVDGDEVTIATGSNTNSIVVETSFSTSNLTAGSYRVGARVTSPTGTVATAYAPGLIEIVSGAFVQVLSPTVGLVVVPGTPVQVVVAAGDPSNAVATIRIFYDLDNTFGNGNDVTLDTLPVSSSGLQWNTSGLPTGSYFIGVELKNGFDPPLFSYSPGPVRLVEAGSSEDPSNGGGGGGGVTDPNAATLIVTSPLTATTVMQGSTFRVNWVTNLALGQGVVRVFRESDLFPANGVADSIDNPNNDPNLYRTTIGNAGIDARTQFVDFDTRGVVGTFFVGVTLTPSAGNPITKYAPGTLSIRPLTFWTGDLGTKRDSQNRIINQTGAFQGAIFRGFNFQDNLGSAMTTADDFDGDGRREIVMVAQFAKPFFVQRDGRGAGEAYMIYSSASRYSGDFEVNGAGSARLPGTIFTGIFPNPFAGLDNDVRAKAGNSIPYTVDGDPAPPFATEGLRSVTMIPDQDGDGKGELVFGIPWCNSYSYWWQIRDGYTPHQYLNLGRLENNGHFLRGGLVVVSSRNSLIRTRTGLSLSYDRTMQLHEVGQIFSSMGYPNGVPIETNYCPKPGAAGCAAPNGTVDTREFPCEGFFQNTIDAPRLADPLPAAGMLLPGLVPQGFASGQCGELVSTNQVDPPPGLGDVSGIVGGGIPGRVGGNTSLNSYCGAGLIDINTGCPIEPFGSYPLAGSLRVLGTGFYYTGAAAAPTAAAACVTGRLPTADEPYGCRILGQTTTQVSIGTTANRFGISTAVSGDFMLIGAPLRTVRRFDVPTLPTATREQAGEVYMLRLRPDGAPRDDYYWALPPSVDPANPPVPNRSLPYPHNYVIQDLGYTRCETPSWTVRPGQVHTNMLNPFHIVGAAPGDRIGEVAGLSDINNDGLTDFAVGGQGTNQGRGAVYIIYRRAVEIEGDYLLENLQLAPTNVNRLNGFMIIGEPGENLGGSIAGAGPLNDDYDNDGNGDLVVGSPNANTSAGLATGQVLIVFGGANLLSPEGGLTVSQIRDQNLGMVLTGAIPGDHAGTTVQPAGDVNGDGIPDILISAPEASPRFDSNQDGFITAADAIGLDFNGDLAADDLDVNGFPDDLTRAGMVYVVFGGSHLKGTISLSRIGTAELPGFVIVGRQKDYYLGGGVSANGVASRGISSAGDIDGDGRADLMVSSILAAPEGKVNAGEVYLIYGVRP